MLKEGKYCQSRILYPAKLFFTATMNKSHFRKTKRRLFFFSHGHSVKELLEDGLQNPRMAQELEVPVPRRLGEVYNNTEDLVQGMEISLQALGQVFLHKTLEFRYLKN